jgi:Ca2+-binding RTX toxin-like protein
LEEFMKANPLGSELRVNSSFVVGDQDTPAIAISPLGTFVIAWESDEQDGDGAGIYARLYRSDGQPVSPEFRVNSTTDGEQTTPAVAMDANGSFAVVWASDDSGDSQIFSQLYDANGQTIGSEVRVGSGDGDQINPAIARNPTGRYVVAWSARNVDGDDADNNGSGIYAQRYGKDGSPRNRLFRVNATTDNDQTNPAVAMQTDGSFIVVWESEQQDSSGSGIFAQRYTPRGRAIGPEFQVNTFIRRDQRNPVVAVNTTGQFVIAWESDRQDGSGTGIYARLYDQNGNPSGQPFQVNRSTRGDQSTPTIGMDAEGNFTIAWTSDSRDEDGSGSGIYAQQFDLNGDRIGEVFRVNSTTEEDQSQPALATQSNGNFVVGWQSQTPSNSDDIGLGDGDGLGIFAQRYQGSNLGGLPSNQIRGDADRNVLRGTAEADRMLGLGGNDRLLGRAGNDILLGGRGDDDLRGQQGDDTLKGGSGQDILRGGAGQDILYGNSGRDTLIGGGGADTYVIGESAGLEEIRGFTDGVDRLALLGGLNFNDLTLQEQRGTTIISVLNNPIALLQNVPRSLISASDFTTV